MSHDENLIRDYKRWCMKCDEINNSNVDWITRGRVDTPNFTDKGWEIKSHDYIDVEGMEIYSTRLFLSPNEKCTVTFRGCGGYESGVRWYVCGWRDENYERRWVNLKILCDGEVIIAEGVVLGYLSITYD